jgi:hypothetical protein
MPHQRYMLRNAMEIPGVVARGELMRAEARAPMRLSARFHSTIYLGPLLHHV